KIKNMKAQGMQDENSGCSIVLLVYDHPPEPQMSALASNLESIPNFPPIKCLQLSQGQYLKLSKKFKVQPIACVVYVHQPFKKKVDSSLIDYCKEGGTLVMLHHAIAQGKCLSDVWLPFCGVQIHRSVMEEFPWFVDNSGEMKLLNLQPGNEITSTSIDWPEKCTLQSSDEFIYSERRPDKTLLETGVGREMANPDVPELEGREFPALTIGPTELFINQILEPLKERVFLLGYSYHTKRVGKTYMGANAGWMLPRGKGRLFYLMAGHETSDFIPPFCQLIWNCIKFSTSRKKGNILE
ncbi:MAG: hypothetical protein ACFFCS_09570, partial [Candidatus Hodarchaeota archaeon]